MPRLAARTAPLLLAPLAALVVVLALAGPVAAQVPTAPAPTEPYDLSKCVSALPPPYCGTRPQASGDRGGNAQIALFVIMTLGMTFIGSVIVRSTLRTNRERRAAAQERAASTGV